MKIFTSIRLFALCMLFFPCSVWAQNAVTVNYQGSNVFGGYSFIPVSTTNPMPISVYGGTNGQCLVSNGTKFIPGSCGGGGSGTVTSITAGSANIVVTPSPLTTTGTIDIGPAVATSANNLGFFASTTSAQLAGVLSDETGTGVAVFGTAPTFTTSITDPLIIGGTGTGSTLTYKTTTGVGATDAHIWQVGNNGATEAMRIQTGGGLGIGTTTNGTNAKLAVNGGMSVGTYANTASAGVANGLIVSGNVGIGSAVPTFALQVTGTGTGSMDVQDNSASGFPSINISDNNGVLRGGIGYGNSSTSAPFQGNFYVAGAGSVNPMAFIAGGSLRMYIATTGSVGIGTATIQNSATLQVNGTIESGVAGATLGSILLAGNTSGVITEKPQAAAGTYNWNLPITAGTVGQFLTSGGGSSTAMTWSTGLTGSGGTPTCGTGCASITAGSTDLRGSMVSNSSVSSVTLNFSATLASAPFCTISDSNTSATADISSISTSALTVGLASALTSVTIYWNCPL